MIMQGVIIFWFNSG